MTKKSYLVEHTSTIETPQSQVIPGHEKDMVKNSADGYSFKLDKWKLLERFIVLGSELGTYYISQANLTINNANNVRVCIAHDGIRVAEMAAQISNEGRAPKNDPAIFVLALVSVFGNKEAKTKAYSLLPKVCRIGTHIYQFCEFRKHMGGDWGTEMKKAISNWYLQKNIDSVTYQAIKYRQRLGWTHRDVLRLSHPIALTDEQNDLFHWIVDPTFRSSKFTPQLNAFLEIKKLDISNKKELKKAVNLIVDNRLPREAIPTTFLKNKDIWEALLQDMPITALIRNLATITRIGLIKPLSAPLLNVCEQITDEERLKKARVHPINILAALKTYEAGKGERGNYSWDPIPDISKALNKSFYTSFQNVEPTGKKFMLSIDVSGSMCWNSASYNLTCAEGAAVMCMATARVEPNHYIMGFSDTFRDLGIQSDMYLMNVLSKTTNQTFGRTDCAQPMIYAKRKGLEVDCFVVYTDSETWFGNIHPIQALNAYRKVSGIPAKLVVVGMEGNEFSIADPKDSGSLDVVGFDTTVPKVISDFARN